MSRATLNSCIPLVNSEWYYYYYYYHHHNDNSFAIYSVTAVHSLCSRSYWKQISTVLYSQVGTLFSSEFLLPGVNRLLIWVSDLKILLTEILSLKLPQRRTSRQCWTITKFWAVIWNFHCKSVFSSYLNPNIDEFKPVQCAHKHDCNSDTLNWNQLFCCWQCFAQNAPPMSVPREFWSRNSSMSSNSSPKKTSWKVWHIFFREC